MNSNRPGKVDRLLFRAVDPVSLTFFRIGLALLLAYAYWPRGFQPSSGIRELPSVVPLYEQLFLTVPYRVVVYAGIILFGLGWRPRVVGVLLMCLLVPHGFLNEGRQSRQVLLFVLLFTSLVHAPPLWRWNDSSRDRRPAGPMWPIRLIQCQVTVLYAVNALYKSTPEYFSGKVLTALSAESNFLLDLTAGHLSLGLWSVPVGVLAAATVAIESWLAIGFWVPRCRWATACIGVAFHVGLEFVIEIFMLDYVSMFLYLAFLLPLESRGPPEVTMSRT